MTWSISFSEFQHSLWQYFKITIKYYVQFLSNPGRDFIRITWIYTNNANVNYSLLRDMASFPQRMKFGQGHNIKNHNYCCVTLKQIIKKILTNVVGFKNG